MQKCSIGKDEPRKSSKKDQKGNRAGIKDVLLLHAITQFRIDGGKSNGGGKIDISLDEGNHLGTTFWCRYHEDILGISQNGVIEENAEKH
mmetsp:Transcript_18047/g.26713  ORF Transcript_18047/g.26713 Transcript_18047/m.26713 type:complete len:90 (-) Transcript_18047:511-780(-)